MSDSEIPLEPRKMLTCPTCGGSGSVEELNPFYNYDDEDSAEEEFHDIACHHCAGAGKLDAARCPHCDSDDCFVERADTASAYVMCNDCGARGPCASQEGDDEETPGGHAAIAAWNRRSSRPAAVEGWRDIASAPKDGTKFVAYSETNGLYDILRWVHADRGYQDHFESTRGYGGIPVAFLSLWQPLPAAPQASTTTEAKGTGPA